MSTNIDLNMTLPVGTTVKIGTRILRNEDEVVRTDGVKKPELPSEMKPMVLVDFSGLKLIDVLKTASNIHVIETQKGVRKLTDSEIGYWREEQFRANGEGVVKILAKTAAHSLDIPKRPEDIVKEIEEKAPALAAFFFSGMSEEEKIEAAPGVYEQITSLSGK